MEMSEKQVEYLKNMDEEQLEFNKRMLSFFEFLGVSSKEIVNAQFVLSTYSNNMDAIASNIKDINKEVSELRTVVNSIFASVPEVKAAIDKNGGVSSTNPMGSIFEPQKGLNDGF